MNYKEIIGIKNKLSTLIYGTGSGKVSGEDDSAAIDCLDMAYEHGFTAFDSANAYGNAEKNLGKWINSRNLREKVTIIDKGCNPGMNGSLDTFSSDTIRNQVNESLYRMNTDYIDIYILHRDDETKPVGPIVEVLNELKDSGKIKLFGGSNWSHTRIEQACKYAKNHGLDGFSVASPCYSYADYINDPWGGSISLSGDNLAGREYFISNQMPVFNYSSLARGFLSGKYRTDGDKPIEDCLWWAPIEEYYSAGNIEKLKKAERLADSKGYSVSQICLAWLLAQPMNLFPIVSPTSYAHIKDNVDACDVILNNEDLKRL